MKKTLIAAITLIITNVVATAQTNTPYSMYGYGTLTDRATSMQNQMGGIGYAMRGGRQINAMNPASYSQIDSLTFLFDMGADLSLLWSKDNGARDHSTGGGLSNVTMQFPLGKHFGGSIGLVPYSSVGYSFGQDVHNGTRQNQGQGGINQLYVGLSGKAGGFSLGANIAYSFGNITNDYYTTPSSSGRTLIQHQMRVRDWDLNVGAMYTQKLTRYDRLTIGVTFTPKKSLHGTATVARQEVTLDSKTDTVGEMKMKNKYYTPMGIGGGLSYVHERTGRLMVEADVTWQNWKKATFSSIPSLKDPGKYVFEGMTFNDRTRYALGAEYIPNLRGNYGQRIAIRLGAYYTEDYLRIQNNDVREYGITAGVGLPTPGNKTLINIGFEWKHRQAKPVALLTENYFNITLGVNFNELWFWQRKIK